MTEVPVPAGVVAAEVEAVTGPAVRAAARTGLMLASLFVADDMAASLAVTSAVDVALGRRRTWSDADHARFGATFPVALRHFLAHARGGDDAVPGRLALVGRRPPREVSEAISAVAVAGPLGADVLSDCPSVVMLVASVAGCLSMEPAVGASAVEPGAVDLCLLRPGLRWRRDGDPPPVPAFPGSLWRPGSETIAFSWACVQRFAGGPGTETLPALLEAASAELIAAGAPPAEIDRLSRELVAELA